MPRIKTTHDYINDYKERLRTAFGEFEGVASKAPDDRDDDEFDEKKQAVEAILAEPTPSDLSEEPPADDDDSINGGGEDDTLGGGEGNDTVEGQ